MNPKLLSGLILFTAMIGLPAAPPGVVITHSPASSGCYIGSPSLVVAPDGEYLVAHDFFGPASGQYVCGISELFASDDQGRTWSFRSRIQNAFFPSLFFRGNALYLIAVDHTPATGLSGVVKDSLHVARLAMASANHIVIRRSFDNGRTWTTPDGPMTGQLMSGHYGFAPTPVIEADGRVWRAQDTNTLSAPADANLLRAANWHLTPGPPADKAWFNGKFEGWGESSMVLDPQGRIVNLAKVRYLKPGDDHAALIYVDADGSASHFDPATGFVKMPGARLKFTARFDPATKHYWALTNYLPPVDYGPRTDLRRNTVALVSSRNLRAWRVNTVLLHDPDIALHGLQYLDWCFENDDIIAVCRTAWPDGQGGPVRQHDANYLTFHRFAGFRHLTPRDGVLISRNWAGR